MESLPWPALGPAAGGWIIAGWFVWALISGRLVTKREADIYVTRAEKAEANVEKMNEQVSRLTAFAELGRATFSALRTNAEEGELR